MTALSLQDAQAYIAKQAAAYGLDPAAVLSVAAGEGLSQAGYAGPHPDPAKGYPNAFAVGPFQLNSAGELGRSPAAGAQPQSASAWAWSPEGIDWALSRIASVAHGKSGSDAIGAIVRLFERPADPNKAIENAQGRYPGYYGQYSTIEDITGSAPVDPAEQAAAAVASSSSGTTNTITLVPGFGPWPGIKISTGFLWAGLLFLGGIVAVVVGVLIYFRREIAEQVSAAGKVAAVAA